MGLHGIQWVFVGEVGHNPLERGKNAGIKPSASIIGATPPHSHNMCRATRRCRCSLKLSESRRPKPASSESRRPWGARLPAWRACKPDSVTARAADGHSSGPVVAGGLVQPTRTARAGEPRGRGPTRSLFGLAPGGACHAADVAAGAVGSCPTLSPLPAGRSSRAVCSLWRFPSGCPGRALPAAMSPRSPDFPRLHAAAIRPSTQRLSRHRPPAGQSRRARRGHTLRRRRARVAFPPRQASFRPGWKGTCTHWKIISPAPAIRHGPCRTPADACPRI